MEADQQNLSGKIDQANQILTATQQFHNNTLWAIAFVLGIGGAILAFFGFKQWNDIRSKLDRMIADAQTRIKRTEEDALKSFGKALERAKAVEAALQELEEDPTAQNPKTKAAVERVKALLPAEDEKTANEHFLLGVAAYEEKNWRHAEQEWRWD